MLPGQPYQYCIFDEETTGIPLFSSDEDDPRQPHIAEFGAVCTYPDLSKKRILHQYVKPDGWEMPDEARKINGLTTEFLHEAGKPIKQLVDLFVSLVDEGYVFGAFNVAFDLMCMRIEMTRLGYPNKAAETYAICLMRMSTPLCKIPYKGKRRNGFKQPKLVEACQILGVQATEEGQMHTGAEDTVQGYGLFTKLISLRAPVKPQTFGA